MGFSEFVESAFRHDSYRPGQKEALLETAEHLDNDKRVVIAELPTGIGKSDIAKALADAQIESMHQTRPAAFSSEFDPASASYIVTSQKILQDQYLRDFGEDQNFVDVRGRSNYLCVKPRSEYEDTCAANKHTCKHANGRLCSYKDQVERGKESYIASTNSAFYMFAAIRWPKRGLTIVDECHNAPDDVLDAVSLSISDNLLVDCGLTSKLYDTSLQYKQGAPNPAEVSKDSFMLWVEEILNSIIPIYDHYHAKAELYKSYVQNKTDEDGNPIAKCDPLTKEEEKIYEAAETIQKRITSLMDSEQNTDWIFEVNFKKGDRVFTARPLDSGFFAPKLYLGQSKQIYLQSATIIDPKRYANDMGISEYQFIQKPSPFKASHRPVFKMDTASLSQKNLANNMDKLCAEIKMILDAFPKYKGIVHCHTYDLQREIVQRVADPRFIAPSTFNKKDSIGEHVKSALPTVLISPSLTEGVDLKGPLARICIICKLPFPYRGDRRIMAKIKRDPGWEFFQTAKTLVQSAGRGVRSQDDWCYTFVLDNAFSWFIKNAVLPPDFLASISTRDVGLQVIKRGSR